MKDNKYKRAWVTAFIAIAILFYFLLSSLNKVEINCEQYTYQDYDKRVIPYKCKEAMEFFRTLPRP